MEEGYAVSNRTLLAAEGDTLAQDLADTAGSSEEVRLGVARNPAAAVDMVAGSIQLLRLEQPC